MAVPGTDRRVRGSKLSNPRQGMCPEILTNGPYDALCGAGERGSDRRGLTSPLTETLSPAERQDHDDAQPQLNARAPRGRHGASADPERMVSKTGKMAREPGKEAP